jgi:hypothetical protein
MRHRELTSQTRKLPEAAEDQRAGQKPVEDADAVNKIVTKIIIKL